MISWDGGMHSYIRIWRGVLGIDVVHVRIVHKLQRSKRRDWLRFLIIT